MLATAHAAQARRGVRDAVLERLSLGGALEAAVLVEEPRVEMEDPVADDVEAEVAGLDHAGVDRPDRDLVGVVAAHRHRPARELEVVVDQRAQRLVAVEARRRTGRLPRVRPSRQRGARSTIVGTRPSGDTDALELDVAVGCDERRADDGLRRRVQAGEAPALARAPARPATRYALIRAPRTSACAMALPGSQQPRPLSGRAGSTTGDGAEHEDDAQARAVDASRAGAARPAVVSIRACASPRNPSARRIAALRRPTGARPANPPATIRTSLTKSGEGGRPASAASEPPSTAPSRGLRAQHAVGRACACARVE